VWARIGPRRRGESAQRGCDFLDGRSARQQKYVPSAVQSSHSSRRSSATLRVSLPIV
jgi:hypothetical protein